ncbi:preprotein translocase subunit SecG [Salidesulfovibrio brasiliensis]|uniref:preprotein translocase subunit SecG n=1 Tax=Salidesulfovibrio brasiliensis TaxID=221711 RepID=UPI0012ED6FE2|nr:preprotein translocase subunit SecG [Salidesulfovibrio brasiliensis]
METIVITIHVLACIFLIAVVLLQSGHEGMGVIFGGGSSTMFGSSGAGGLLVRITAGLAAVFLVTSLTYNVLTGNKVADADSIMLEADGIVTPAPVEDRRFPESNSSTPKRKPKRASNASTYAEVVELVDTLS